MPDRRPLIDNKSSRLLRENKKLKEVIKEKNSFPLVWEEYVDSLNDLQKDIFLQIPPYLFQLYRMEKFLIRGGQGATFLVKDGMGRRALMKIGKYHDLKSEYIALQSIVSPNIISLYYGERFGEAMVLVEEYVPGINLGQIIRKSKKNRWLNSDSYNVFITMTLIQVIGALNSIHYSYGDCEETGKLEDRSFVHRDIKPDNIMLGFNGRTKLIDFGLARKTGSISKNRQLGFSIPFGSPNQMSNYPHENNDDYFSFSCLAVVLFEGGHDKFFDASDIKNIINGKASEFIQRQNEYFSNRIDKLLPILQNVEKIIKKKFIPKNFKSDLKEMGKNPDQYGGQKAYQTRENKVKEYIESACQYPLAAELFAIIKAPFEYNIIDSRYFAHSCHVHRFIHYEYMGRQALLMKPNES